MPKIDPTVKRETGFVALCVLVGSILLEAVFLLMGQWDYTVLLGNLLGGVTAVGNFLLMGLMIQKAIRQDEKAAVNTVRLSQGGRLFMQGLVLMLAAVLSCFNIWAAAIPLLIPRVGFTLRQWFGKKPAAPATSASSAEPDDDMDEEEALL